jgi:hypothetical protein
MLRAVVVNEVADQATWDDFKTLYPKRVAMKDAEKAWAQLTSDERIACLTGLVPWREAWLARGEMQFVPYPATFLRGHRWEDDLPEKWNQNRAAHQSLTQTILIFSAKEAIFPIKNLHPQTKDKLVMEDVDISYAYSVNAAAIADLYIRYGPSAHWYHDGEFYPMATFIENLLRSAVNDAVAKYDALAVNDNRVPIQNAIMDDVRSKIAAERLDGKVNISQVILTTAVIPASVRESATSVVTAQNALKAKQFELQTTQVEAQRMQALALQADDRYIRYLNAQALLKMAEHMESGCWEFQGNRQAKGHGRLNYHTRKVLAHRLAWELTHGPIPDGMLVCHHCDNPPCCNPLHLYVGTHKDNTGDAMRRGRQWIPYRPDYM